MRSAIVALLAMATCALGEPLAQCENAVLSALTEPDPLAALVARAREDHLDPWLVVEVLRARGRPSLARTFAKSLQGPIGPLEEYSDVAPPDDIGDALTAAIEAQRRRLANDASAALDASSSRLPLENVTAVLLAQQRAGALQDLDRWDQADDESLDAARAAAQSTGGPPPRSVTSNTGVYQYYQDRLYTI